MNMYFVHYSTYSLESGCALGNDFLAEELGPFFKLSFEHYEIVVHLETVNFNQDIFEKFEYRGNVYT